MRWIILCLLGVIVLVIVAMVKLKKHEDSKVDEKEVYEAIFLAIQEKLEILVEDAVFKAKSYEQLGAYYYKYILNNVDGATVDRINKIVAAITHLEDNLTQSEYYKAIVEDQGIKILPALALKEVEARYGEVFINQLNAVRTKYNQELTKISTKKDSTDHKIHGPEEVASVGANAKMNEFCAAMGLCNLRHLDEEIEKRKRVVDRYREQLDGVKGIRLNIEQKNVKSNYAYFPVVIDEKEFGSSRQEVFDALANNGIGARKYFYPLTNTFSCFHGQFDVNETPNALSISKRVLTLPLYADLAIEDVDRICEIVRKETQY